MFSRRSLLVSPASALFVSLGTFATRALAHGNHHESNIPEGETVSRDPIDTIMWIHIFIQMLAYGVIFPVGMIFGITKSRWHVPTQIFGTILAIVGFFLGHAHRGREFVESNVHATFAWILQILLGAQVVLGLYLKGHWERGINGFIRKLIRPCHSVLGKAMTVFSWTQMLFGGITALGFCQGEHVGQCTTYFTIGSALIGYGIILTIILLVGQVWIRSTGRSQEFYDSAAIAAFGCVNTFIGHRWGTDWESNDWQHTAVGVTWWCAGLAGIWLSRDREGQPKRNFVPAFVMFITGWALSATSEELADSVATHSVFGYTLMAAGVARIVEIAFVLRDAQTIEENGRSFNSFQFIPIYLLYAAGFLLMGATEEQMRLVAGSDMDYVSYILILFSLAFLVFLFANMLVNLYDRLANPAPSEDKSFANGNAGYASVNGRPVEEGRVGDAEEFELGGLSSDDEEEDRMLRRSGKRRGQETGVTNARES